MKKIIIIAMSILLIISLASCVSAGSQGPQGVQGPQGPQGVQGPQGGQGNDGLSAFEIFQKYYPDYIGTEQEWIDAVVKGEACALIGHNYTEIIYEPSCFSNGYTLHKCSYCTNEYSDTIVVSTGHDYELTEHKDYLGTTDGYDRYKCKNCGDSYESIITSPIHKVSVWDGETKTKPEKLVIIDGIYYYEINSAAELAYLQIEESTYNNYILNTDVILNELTIAYDENGELMIDSISLNVWTGFRCQRFEGNGYKISGLYGIDCGLISYCDSVRNLSVSNAYVSTTTTKTIGGIANGAADIINCEFEGVVIGVGAHDNWYPDWADSFVGGVAGRCTQIQNCISHGLVIGNYGVGGLCGSTDTAYDSINYATVISKTDHAGGICGFNEWWSGIYRCTNYGTVSGHKNVGGIVGTVIGNSNAGSYDCYNYGQVTGTNNVGGICGSNRTGVVTSCVNYANVVGNYCVGGICGYSAAEATYNTSLGSVSGDSNVGAVIGYADIMSDELLISDNEYLQNEYTNSALFGIGNMNNNNGCSIIHNTES